MNRITKQRKNTSMIAGLDFLELNFVLQHQKFLEMKRYHENFFKDLRV